MPEEARVIELKYSGPRFSSIPEHDVELHAMGLLIRLNAVTGWKIPDDGPILNTLVSEFSKFITESFSDMNPEEVAYAFRNYATGIKDWGKSMNLSLIEEPLQAYRNERRRLSELEERARMEPTEDELPVGECDWSDQWESIKEQCRNGQIEQAIILTPVYDWLVREGLLNLDEEEKKGLLAQCREEYAQELKLSILEGNSEYEELSRLLSTDCLKDSGIKARLINMSKIKAVKQLALSETL